MSSNLQKLKYPFSREARQASLRYARDLKALADLLERPENHYLVEEAENRVYAAITQSEIVYHDMRDEKQVLVYSAARLIVEEIGNPRLRAHQAEAESKAVNRMLADEDNQLVEELCSDSLGWKIESLGGIHERSGMPLALRTYEYRMRFENFLEVAPDFHADEWKLINRYLDRGWVFIRRRELNRLISGKFRQIIMSGHLEIPKLPQRLAEAVQRVEVESRGKIRQYEPIKITGQVTAAFPPCMQKLYDDSVSGQVNLPHDARFALAAFLLKVGMSEAEVNKVFGHSPDSDNRQIGYQVDHIASKRSTKSETTGYTPTGCKKLQTNNLCPVYLGLTEDPLCEYVLNPLAFYTTRVWELSREPPITNHSWYAKSKEKKQSLYQG
jgi:DNA primase large subunit